VHRSPQFSALVRQPVHASSLRLALHDADGVKANGMLDENQRFLKAGSHALLRSHP
jgi:hypothetical protein